MTAPTGAAVAVHGTVGPSDAEQRLLLLYTGGTIGMTTRADGALVPQDFGRLAAHLRDPDELPVGVTVAAFDDPIDSSAIRPGRWLDIADAVVDLAGDHTGVVVLHGTDTMAYTASALAFLLDGVDRPVVLTGSQRPLGERRSDADRNLYTAGAFAALQDAVGAPVVPEVTVAFGDVLLRGCRSRKVSADRFSGFASPDLPPLAHAGVSLEVTASLVRPPGTGGLRRAGSLCADVAAIKLHPALDEHTLTAVLTRPGLRGVVVEAYGAGNGPSESWFLRALEAATASGIVVLVTTQCDSGAVRAGQYATGAALFETGAVAGADLTFEAALTKLMALLDRHPADEVRRLLPVDLVGELTPPV